MSKVKDLGNRMKLYEKQYSGQVLLPGIPVCARMDGRAFHSFCKGLERPYDARLSELMILTTKYLVGETNAKIGYTQSDEISLIWHQDSFENEIFFDAKLLKMTSILASMTTAYFNSLLAATIPEKAGKMPLFDARVWNVPSQVEAVNYLIWREMDATRNSVSMAAQSMFSHKELHKCSSSVMQEMMFDKYKVNWNDYPAFFKRGTYVQRAKVEIPFTSEEIEKLHPKHAAKNNPNLIYSRGKVEVLDLQPLKKIENRQEIVFLGAKAKI